MSDSPNPLTVSSLTSGIHHDDGDKLTADPNIGNKTLFFIDVLLSRHNYWSVSFLFSMNVLSCCIIDTRVIKHNQNARQVNFFIVA